MQNSAYTIHVLRPTDGSLIRRLNEVFGRAFDEAETYGRSAPDDAYLERLLSKSHVVVIAALHEGEVVGGLVAYELEKFESPRSEFYLYDLAVDERHRRRGVASALIDRLKDVASERGGWVIFVQADHGDNAAIALYQRIGAREDVLHFDIPVARSD